MRHFVTRRAAEEELLEQVRELKELVSDALEEAQAQRAVLRASSTHLLTVKFNC